MNPLWFVLVELAAIGDDLGNYRFEFSTQERIDSIDLTQVLGSVLNETCIDVLAAQECRRCMADVDTGVLSGKGEGVELGVTAGLRGDLAQFQVYTEFARMISAPHAQFL